MNKLNEVLVVDVGQAIIGILNVNDREYIPYFGNDRKIAIERLGNAIKIITYNGNRYDIDELNALSYRLFGKQFTIAGAHIDMRELCWPGILGMNLKNTYLKYFEKIPSFQDSYEGSNRLDVFMTWQLWEYWHNKPKIQHMENNSLAN